MCLEILPQIRRGRYDELMTFGHHSLKRCQLSHKVEQARVTDQKLINSLWHLELGPRNCDHIICHFCAGDLDSAVPLSLKLVKLRHARDKLSMIQSIDDDRFRNELGVLEK